MLDYECEIRTDYVEPERTEEIVKNVEQIISRALKNVPPEEVVAQKDSA